MTQPQNIICEICKSEPSSSISHVRDRWFLAGACSVDSEDYYITFDRFFGEQQQWLIHMREKRWFVEADYTACVARLVNKIGAGV